MEIVIVQLVVSLGLVAGAILLFAQSIKSADAEQADRLSLLPLEEDTKKRPQP